MSSNAAGGSQLSGTGTRVHGDWLADDEAIGNQFANGLAGVGVGDLVDLIGVEPDLALSCTGDGGRQALLGGEVDPTAAIVLVSCFDMSFCRCQCEWRGEERSCGRRNRGSAVEAPVVICAFLMYGIVVVLTS